MNILEKIYSKISTYDIEVDIKESIIETKEDIANLNAEQMFSGIDSNRERIEPPYSMKTIFKKKKKGQVTDRVTLRDTGDFYNQLTAEVKENDISIFSKDYKNNELERKYGKEIFGLIDENKIIYVYGNFYKALLIRIKKNSGI